jgi:hypothetical protein
MSTLFIYISLWSQLFISSFSSLSFKEAKTLEKSISNTVDIQLLFLLKGDAREYSGFSIAAFMLSLWLTIGSLIVFFVFMSVFTFILIIVSLSLSIFFFRHWQNSNALHSECMSRISINTP